MLLLHLHLEPDTNVELKCCNLLQKNNLSAQL